MEYIEGVTLLEDMILDLAKRVETIEKKLEEKTIPEYLSASCPCSPTRFLTKDIGRICWRCDMSIYGDEREYRSVME